MLLGSCLSKLSITNPTIQNSYGMAEIPFTYYPISTFPYGRILYGYLHHETQDGCSSFEIQTPLNPKDISFFLIMESGNCEISLKAYNAQRADAELIMIITDEKIDKKMMQNNIHPTN